MSQTSITFSGDTTKKFVVNHRRGDQYRATFQNNTNQSITITVTNQPVESSGSTFTAPVTAMVVASGSMIATNEPYDGWLLTALAAATGTVDIVEAG